MSSTNTSSPSTMNAPAKKSSKKVAEPVAVAPVVVDATPAPSAPKKVAKKASAPASEAPAVVAPVVPTPAPVATPAPATEATTESTLADELKAVQDQLTAIRDAANSALSALKRVGKRASQEIKEARKNRRRARAEPAEGEVRKPSNFEIPKPVSDELSIFLGGGKNNQMSRAQVNSLINKYVNEKGLRTKHDITPDAPLRKLLGVDESVKLTIFNIQQYLNKHYLKPATATTATTAPASK